MDEKRIPSWIVILVCLTVICICMFGFLEAQDRVSSGSGSYQFIGFAFLIPAFIAALYTMGRLIEDGRTRRKKDTSEFRKSEYEKKLSGEIEKYGGRNRRKGFWG